MTNPRKQMGMMSPVSVDKVERDAAALPAFPYEEGRSKVVHPVESSDHGVRAIKISQLAENLLNPRSSYLEEEILAMAESLRKNGLLNPLHAAIGQDSNKYILIAGHTRLRAIRMYLQDDPRFDEVPVILHRHLNSKQIAIMAFEENSARAQQRPVDLGLYWSRLLEAGVFSSAAEIAGAMNTTESTVSRMLTFTKLPSTVLEIILKNPDRFGYTHAVELNRMLQFKGEQAVITLAEEIISGKLSYREAAKIVDRNQISNEPNHGDVTRQIVRFADKGVKGSAIFFNNGEFKLNLKGLTDEKQQALIDSIKSILYV